MLNAEDIRDRILAALPDARVEVRDMTGGGDHWQVAVVDAAFAGRSPVARQRLIYDLFRAELDGPIHALTLTTQTPDEAARGLRG